MVIETTGTESADATALCKLALLCRSLVEDPAVFKDFVSNPLTKLRSLGVSTRQDFAHRAEGKSLLGFLMNGGDPLSRLAPGEVDIPASMVWQQAQEPPWVVPVAIVAV